jgi:hypothetical protein
MSTFVSEKKISPPVRLLQPPLSTKEIGRKILSMTARDIELIGSQIINNAMNNLGPAGKARVDQEVMKVKGLSEDPMDIEPIGSQIINNAVNNLGPASKARVDQETMKVKGLSEDPMDIEKGKSRFLSDEDTARFKLAALDAVKKEIAGSFSRPHQLIDGGLSFQVSGNEPTGFVLKAAVGIDLTLKDIPSRYYIHLKLDEKLTQEKSDLVFVLTETSEGVEFSKTSFTVRQLEQDFLS